MSARGSHRLSRTVENSEFDRMRKNEAAFRQVAAGREEVFRALVVGTWAKIKEAERVGA